MAIIRQKRKKRFSIIDNRVIEDKRLTWGARGLLEYMLSKPDDWKFYMSELITHSDNEGRDKTYGYLKELKKYGYVIRKQGRNSKGKFEAQDLIVTDTPALPPYTGSPDTGKPDTGRPDTESPQLLNTDLLNTDKTNKRETKKDDDDTAASQADENPFDVATQAGINVNSGLHLPIFLDFIKTLGNSLVCWAIRQTDNNAQHPNWSYLMTVLKNLEANSVRTVEQAERLSEEYKQKTRRSYRGRNVPQVRETMPDWGKQDEATRTKKASASALAKARARQAKNREAKEGVKS